MLRSTTLMESPSASPLTTFVADVLLGGVLVVELADLLVRVVVEDQLAAFAGALERAFCDLRVAPWAPQFSSVISRSTLRPAAPATTKAVGKRRYRKVLFIIRLELAPSHGTGSVTGRGEA